MNKARIISIATYFLISCQSADKKIETTSEENNLKANELVYSNEQLKIAKVEIGNPNIHLFQETIETTGKIITTPDGTAEVNSIVSGNVQQLFVNEGQEVKKGQKLIQIRSNQALELQQQFVESEIHVAQVTSELERIKTLADNDISAKKELKTKEFEYLKAKSQQAALSIKLQSLNIDLEKVKNGNLSASITIFAPISGIVNRIAKNIGSSIEPNESILLLINPSSKMIQFQVFEKDFSAISIGQKVLFHNASAPESKIEASIITIENYIDSETNSLQCLANLVSKNVNIPINAKGNVHIILNETEAFALPNTAIVNDTKILVWKKDNGKDKIFELIEIEPIISDVTHTALKQEGIKNVVLTGAYNMVPED